MFMRWVSSLVNSFASKVALRSSSPYIRSLEVSEPLIRAMAHRRSPAGFWLSGFFEPTLKPTFSSIFSGSKSPHKHEDCTKHDSGSPGILGSGTGR